MVGWLTALLVALIAVASLSVREHATFDAATPSGEGVINSVSAEYQTLIDVYTTNYKSYIKNQDLGSKAAADTAQAHIQDALDTMREQINQNQFYIQTFLDDYQEANPELADLHEKAQKLKKEGPRIADELATSTQDPPARVDYGGMTVRLIVLAIILGVALAINAFV